MSQNFRHPEILALAKTMGKVTVEGLAAHFDVTVQTIRRDLSDLADLGHLERVHGGAVLPSGVKNIGYSDRRKLNEAAKTAIGGQCAADIPDGASLCITIGTTTESVARALMTHENLLVVTNNMNVANILVGNPRAEIIVTGGNLRRTDGGLVGALTQKSLEQFKIDIAVVSCSAIDIAGDLLDFDVSEVEVNKTVLRNARRRVLVIDHSKFKRTAPVRIGSLFEFNAIYTDRPLPALLASRCHDAKIEVHICAPKPSEPITV